MSYNINPLYLQEGIQNTLYLASHWISAILHQFGTPVLRKRAIKKKYPTAADLKKGMAARAELLMAKGKQKVGLKLKGLSTTINPTWGPAEYDSFLEQYTRVRIGKNIAAMLLLDLGTIIRLFKMGFALDANKTMDHMVKY